MPHVRFHRHALFAALLSLGLVAGAHAQTSGSTRTSPSGTTAAQPGAGSTGMDKGAGTGSTRAGDTKATATQSGDMQVSGSERRFVEKAARDGLAEVQLGQLAQQRAQDAQVKDFGRRMVEDHGKANDQLKTLASAKGITLPADLDGSHKRLADKLGKASGADFDRMYMKEMVDEHEKDVKAFRQMAKSAKDAEVRSFASAQLPILEEHLRMAQAAHSASASGKSGATAARSGAGTASSTTAAPTSPHTPTEASGTASAGSGSTSSSGAADGSSATGATSGSRSGGAAGTTSPSK
jgi:putative membrane protein